MAIQAQNSRDEMHLYVSTNETTPFYVRIENNKKIFDSIKISKGSPQKVPIEMRMMTTGSNDSVRVATKKGLHVFGDKKFFANLRFSQFNHAEIITSKGRASLGKHFFAVYAPFKQDTNPLNFTVGVIATENNTQINFMGETIFLNRGESYLKTGYPMDNSFIGKEITSDKPISITNGNYNGQYASTNPESGSDILMDQSIPIERLGKEYILLKGNGTITSGMESAIIVATENNTEVYLNATTTPVTTLQKGQYYIIPSNFYIEQNATSSNIYIRSTENIYVFQLLSGSGSVAAGGMNYIPPLNCYLPKTIDEIGFINENSGNSSQGYFNTHDTKLNIITQKSPNPANPTKVYLTSTTERILLNGAYGPYNVSGTTEWETFSVPNVEGTITIESERAVTAGIAAGSNAVGYGGYFAGASSMPIITKSGDCFPNVVLEVDDTFENYQWQKKNTSTGIFEDISGATSHKLIPDSVGEYKAILGTPACGTTETPVYTILNCTSNSTIKYTEVCNSIIIPLQLTNSTFPVNLSKTRILEQPKRGTLETVNNTLIYTPNFDYKGGEIDRFMFYVEDTNVYPDSEIITVEIVFREPKRSTLSDKMICKDTTTFLDPGAGFTTYNWSNGETTQIINNVPAGKYYVDLEFDGCKYRHFVEITEAPVPVITSIEVNGGTATINVKGGTAPYSYSVDGITWQSFNVFNNLDRKVHTAYVKDRYNCNPVTKEFLIINLINVITPNDDGKNDSVDYSDLSIYQDVVFEIYDRFGNRVFKASEGNYIWDGKVNGRSAATGNYWYLIKWYEPDTDQHKVYNGWILVKNR